MAGTIGKAFKISKKQTKGYGYAKPNPGVTAIAAINGRGAYSRSRSARSAMSGLSPNARKQRARKLTAPQRSQFAARVRAAKGQQGMYYTNKGRAKAGTGHRSPKSIRAAKKNIKAAQAARRAWGRKLTPGTRYRIGEAKYGATPGARKLPTGVYAANRRRRLEAMFNMNRKRRVTRKRRQTAKQRAASLRNLKKARRSLKPNRKRRAAPKRRRVAKRRLTTNCKRRAAPKRRRVAKRRVARRRLTTNRKRRAAPKRRRKSSRRRMTSNKSRKRSLAAKKGWRKRKTMKTNRKRRAAPKRRRKSSRRRSHKRNAWYKQPRRHRAAAKKGWARRKGYKSNRRRAFRRNQWQATLIDSLKAGALITAGFVAQKALSKVLSDFVVSKIVGTSVVEATPSAPAEPAAISGFEALEPYKGMIAGALAAALGIVATGYVVKDANTKKMVMGGMAASFVHTVLVNILVKTAPEAAGYLSGYSNGTAARLSAMYGMGGTSILPHYAPIGEYFSESVNGLGEYFSESVSGLGNYGSNPDMLQAAAGYGSVAYGNGNHIDPSSDLDRELSIAEAAAGVGQIPAYEASAGMGNLPAYEASAGIGEYFSEGVSGLGAISTVPRADTWIPGMANGQLWAGVRGIDRRQSATAMVPAGVLQSGGGQGVFG